MTKPPTSLDTSLSFAQALGFYGLSRNEWAAIKRDVERGSKRFWARRGMEDPGWKFEDMERMGWKEAEALRKDREYE